MAVDNGNIDEVFAVLEGLVGELGKPLVAKIAEEADPFKILIATVISARTRDSVTGRICEELFSRIRGPEDLLEIGLEDLQKILYPAGFYRVKAARLKQLARILVERYGGKVPDSLEGLLELPGVGRKTANLVLTLGFGRQGISVDTHVHRIVNRWGYVGTRTPEETEMELRRKLPEKFWKRINPLLVSFGQRICTPLSPKCGSCPLNAYCPKIGVEISR